MEVFEVAGGQEVASLLEVSKVASIERFSAQGVKTGR
jgi:hypothetical protein